MPKIEIEVPNFELEFEVFCGTCNNGLCGNTETRQSRNRSIHQIVVSVCDKCIERERNDIEQEYQSEISTLEDKIKELEKSLSEAK